MEYFHQASPKGLVTCDTSHFFSSTFHPSSSSCRRCSVASQILPATVIRRTKRSESHPSPSLKVSLFLLFMRKWGVGRSQRILEDDRSRFKNMASFGLGCWDIRTGRFFFSWVNNVLGPTPLFPLRRRGSGVRTSALNCQPGGTEAPGVGCGLVISWQVQVPGNPKDRCSVARDHGRLRVSRPRSPAAAAVPPMSYQRPLRPVGAAGGHGTVTVRQCP